MWRCRPSSVEKSYVVRTNVWFVVRMSTWPYFCFQLFRTQNRGAFFSFSEWNAFFLLEPARAQIRIAKRNCNEMSLTLWSVPNRMQVVQHVGPNINTSACTCVKWGAVGEPKLKMTYELGPAKYEAFRLQTFAPS